MTQGLTLSGCPEVVEMFILLATNNLLRACLISSLNFVNIINFARRKNIYKGLLFIPGMFHHQCVVKEKMAFLDTLPYQ